MLELAIKTLLAYLLGTLLGSLLLGKLRGVDIRAMGSGNAGATNALRTQGKGFGLAVLVIDILKGVIAVRWLPHAVLPGIGIDPALARDWLQVACGFATIIGHVYPVWYGFRGGKGAATVVGVVTAIEPLLLLPMVIAWGLVLKLTGYVGLSTIVAAIVLVLVVGVWQPGNTALLCFSLATAAFIIFTHRSNIARMRAGTENRTRARSKATTNSTAEPRA